MRTRSARVVAHAIFAVTISVAAFVACSDDERPQAVTAGTSSSSGSPASSSGSVDASSGSSSSSGAPTDSGASSSGATTDAAPDAPVFKCAGDTSLEKDGGGALPTSCPQSATCNPRCTNVTKNFKVGTAQVAIDCFLKLSTCGPPGVPNCMATALDYSCVDDTVKAFCTPMVTNCDPKAGTLESSISVDECERFARALNATGRAAMKACLEEKITAGTCAQDYYQCTGALQ